MEYKVVYNELPGGFSLSKIAAKWIYENGRDEIKKIAEKGYITANEIERHDVDLIRCIETLGGSLASGICSYLVVHTLRGNSYRIQENIDGTEKVCEPDDDEYITIP